jgi:hypothetical protein
LSAKVAKASRARVLAAQQKWTEVALPDWLVTGLAPASAAACWGSWARSRMGADLGQDLGQVDLADAGHGRQHGGLGMGSQGGEQRPVQVGDAGQQGTEQLDLSADPGGQHLGIGGVDGHRGGAQPGQQRRRGAVAAGGMAPAERGQPALSQPLAAWGVG